MFVNSSVEKKSIAAVFFSLLTDQGKLASEVSKNDGSNLLVSIIVRIISFKYFLRENFS